MSGTILPPSDCHRLLTEAPGLFPPVMACCYTSQGIALPCQESRTMRVLTCLGCLLIASLAPAQGPGSSPEKRPAAELEQLLHRAVVANMPKVYEDRSAWGQTVRLPERLRLPRLRRTVVQVGDHLEAPDGLWRKVRLWLDEPGRDLTLTVERFQAVDLTTYRLTVRADALVASETDVQDWRNGLKLLDLTARATARVQAQFDCEVTSRLDNSKRLPGLALRPKVKELKLSLKEFDLQKVTFHRAGLTVETEGVGEAFREALEARLKDAEPKLRQHAEERLAQALKEGKGPLTAPALLKAAAPLLQAAPAKPAKPGS